MPKIKNWDKEETQGTIRAKWDNRKTGSTVTVVKNPLAEDTPTPYRFKYFKSNSQGIPEFQRKYRTQQGAIDAAVKWMKSHPRS